MRGRSEECNIVGPSGSSATSVSICGSVAGHKYREVYLIRQLDVRVPAKQVLSEVRLELSVRGM